jgi:pyruvate dehydrogenase E2 component (dihydrolipoamide acetyltransferase)
MAINILMPALSPTMTEGTLARWLKKQGESVKAGDVIAEIETDKATMEVEAVDEGVLGKILVADGTEGVKVNAPIAILVQAGEAVPDSASPAPTAPAAAPATAGGAAKGGRSRPPCQRARQGGAHLRLAARQAGGEGDWRRAERHQRLRPQRTDPPRRCRSG